MKPIEELVSRGDITFTGDGRIAVAGLALDLMQWLDRQIVNLADEARQLQFPSVIAGEVLERANYFDSFPKGATRVEAGDRPAFLSPAVCYHCFAHFAGMKLDEPLCLSCQGKCYRNETGATPAIGRLWEFTMRELIFIDRGEIVRQRREKTMNNVRRLADSIGLNTRLELASDPFFGAIGRGRKLLQQVKELKYELVTAMPDGSNLAIASFNLHETFFTSRFGIAMASASETHSGCVAFGLERWMLALIGQRGREKCAQLCS